MHPNTLAYRLRRFGEITGRDLAQTAEFAEVWLALLARGHIAVEGDTIGVRDTKNPHHVTLDRSR